MTSLLSNTFRWFTRSRSNNGTTSRTDEAPEPPSADTHGWVTVDAASGSTPETSSEVPALKPARPFVLVSDMLDASTLKGQTLGRDYFLLTASRSTVSPSASVLADRKKYNTHDTSVLDERLRASQDDAPTTKDEGGRLMSFRLVNPDEDAFVRPGDVVIALRPDSFNVFDRSVRLASDDVSTGLLSMAERTAFLGSSLKYSDYVSRMAAKADTDILNGYGQSRNRLEAICQDQSHPQYDRAANTRYTPEAVVDAGSIPAEKVVSHDDIAASLNRVDCGP